jgi:acyl-coenzyme A thioesterase 13
MVLIYYQYHDSLASKIMNLEEVTIAPTGEASAVFTFVVPKTLCR